MKQVIVSNRDLKIMVKMDELTADQVAAVLSKQNNVHISGDHVVQLIRERGIQQKNIKRSTDFLFVNPDELPVSDMEAELIKVAAVAETIEEPISTFE
jgi:hypothetical protein